MKIKIVLLIITSFIIIQKAVIAQNLSGQYKATGYFFHPISSRKIDVIKNITKIGKNKYQVDMLGDLAYWGFQFTVDSNNHLENWVATGDTYPAPASGFMTADNPGGFSYSGPLYPGTTPWIQQTYNNTYDPLTKTFYLHYGYDASASNQNGYSRQIYESYTLAPTPQISSVTPLTGTLFSQVTIKGNHFLQVDPSNYSILVGDYVVDTAWVVSNTKIVAVVSAGESGNVIIADTNQLRDTFPGFVYTPPAPVTNSGWSYVGNAGFSPSKADYLSMACGTDNIPYVAFHDSATDRIKVMKFKNNIWNSIGGFVSAGKAGYTDIVITKDNVPIVAFVDSSKGNNVTVKKLTSGNWVPLGTRGFAPAFETLQTPFSLAIDGADIPYILCNNNYYEDSITVFKFVNNVWTVIGQPKFVVSGTGKTNLTINKNTNVPFIIFDNENEMTTYGYEATVMKFTGTKWINVGMPRITSTKYGIYNPDIIIDNSGNPMISLQDDNGFERLSVYKFTDKWNFVGPQRFSGCRSYNGSISVDKNNDYYVLFSDGFSNNFGTVKKFNKTLKTWDTVGRKNFISSTSFFERHSLCFDTTNTPMVVFSDRNYGGKISVMKYIKSSGFSEDISTVNSNAVSLNNKIKVFPNPAYNSLTITFSKPETGLLQIINTSGQTIIEKKLSHDQTQTLDISKLVAGSYMLSINSTNGTYSKLFLKN